MTAFLVTAQTLPQATAVTGPQFTVPLGGHGAVTHWGCNGQDCLPEIASALAGLEGCVSDEEFWPLCAGLGVGRIETETP